jgi:hypothetical protein
MNVSCSTRMHQSPLVTIAGPCFPNKYIQLWQPNESLRKQAFLLLQFYLNRPKAVLRTWATQLSFSMKLMWLSATAKFPLIAAGPLGPGQHRAARLWHLMGNDWSNSHSTQRSILFMLQRQWSLCACGSQTFQNIHKGDKLTNNLRSLLTGKIIRQRVGGGKKTF